MRRLLVFAPFSGIWPHGLSEAELLSQLDPRRFSLTVVNCGGMFSDHCVVMESFRLEHDAPLRDKSRVCRTCRKCTDALESGFGYERLILDDYSRAEDRAEADDLVARATPTDYVNLAVDDLDIGRLCSYETLIKYKKTSVNLSDDEFAYYRKSLHTALLSFRAARRILEEGNFDAVLTYSPQYSGNLMCVEAALGMGLPCYFLEGSSNIHERYKAIRVWSWPHFKMVNPALSYYSEDAPAATPEDEARVAAHYREIALGRSYSVYSATSDQTHDIRRIHGIPDGARVLLAALSSYDEAFSALVIGGFPKEKFESDVFPTQFDWITALVDWVSGRDNTHLVIRLHPRDLPNRRDSVVSEQSARWSQILDGLPPNVSVDHPDQRIPIASYFSQIDALTTGWSSTAMEAMMENVPVVTYDRHLPSYPAEIHYTGRTREQYWTNLDAALDAPRSVTTRSSAVRWMSFNFNRGTVRVRGRMFDQSGVQQNRILYYAVGGVSRYLPGIGRWMDIRLGRLRPVTVDAPRLNRLLESGASSLYDVN